MAGAFQQDSFQLNAFQTEPPGGTQGGFDLISVMLGGTALAGIANQPVDNIAHGLDGVTYSQLLDGVANNLTNDTVSYTMTLDGISKTLPMTEVP